MSSLLLHPRAWSSLLVIEPEATSMLMMKKNTSNSNAIAYVF